jgi:hypothetical protein
MTPTAVVRPLPGAGLVTRSGELLLVCADGAAGVEELLGLVAEVASSGGDGSVLVRRVAALLAADFAGRYPACAVSGPAGDGRLAVLVHGSALATVVGGEGEVVLSAADAITSVNRLVPGPISAVRLELPGAGSANPLSRLEAGVITAAGVVAGDAPDGPAPSWTRPRPPRPRSSRSRPPRRGRVGRLERFVHHGQSGRARVAAPSGRGTVGRGTPVPFRSPWTRRPTRRRTR